MQALRGGAVPKREGAREAESLCPLRLVAHVGTEGRERAMGVGLLRVGVCHPLRRLVGGVPADRPKGPDVVDVHAPLSRASRLTDRKSHRAGGPATSCVRLARRRTA
jgi:hypothetical protein